MSLPLGREAIAALGLDAEMVGILAQTSSGAALSRRRDWQNRRERAGGPPSQQRSILPHLDEDDLLLAQAATLHTMSASYSLLIGELGEARAAYASGSDLLDLIGNEEADVLAMCAGRAPKRRSHSAWLGALVRAFFSASGNGLDEEEPPRVQSSRPTSPTFNISTESLDALASRMSESGQRDSSDDAITGMLKEMLTELALPVDRLRGSARWREQTSDFLPIEPELLAVAMIATTWTSRQHARDLDVNSVVASVALSAASAMLNFG